MVRQNSFWRLRQEAALEKIIVSDAALFTNGYFKKYNFPVFQTQGDFGVLLHKNKDKGYNRITDPVAWPPVDIRNGKP